MKIQIQINNKLIINNQLNQIFEIIEKLTAEEGGDGCTLVLSNNPSKLADLYDCYRINSFGKVLKRHENLFTDESNENILFSFSDDIEDFFFHKDKDYPDDFWENKFCIFGDF